MATILLGQNDCSAQSIVKALDNFLRAVQQMGEVVMVPNRLKDINGQIVVKENGKTSTTLMPFTSTSKNVDLFRCYSMLHAIRNELVCGNLSEKKEPEPVTSLVVDENHQEVDEQTLLLAVSFRQHMKGLYSILDQLTTSADILSKKYQEEVNGEKK